MRLKGNTMIDLPVKRLTIGQLPLSGSSNPYVDRMADNLRRLGDLHPFPSMREFTFNPLRVLLRRYDVLILNWIENAAYNSKGNLSFLRKARLHVYLAAAKLIARKVIWVRHNNYPHGVTSLRGRASTKALLTWMERYADVVITHSPVEARGKRKYVPHPLYSTKAADDNPLATQNYFFMFGHMAPYKRLDEVIRLAPPGLELVIAGPANNPAYLEKLQSLAQERPNIHLLPGFLDSSVAARIAKDSRGIIVANADVDMVVSGSYIYALSLNVPLYAVRTPFVSWLDSESGVGGVHVFDTLESLLSEVDTVSKEDIRPDPTRVDELFGDKAILRHLSLALEITVERV